MMHIRRFIYISLMIGFMVMEGFCSAAAAPIKLTYSCFFPPQSCSEPIG